MVDKIFFTIRALAIVGIILALYLLYEQWEQPTRTLCSINSLVNCDAIIKGEVAKTLGVPTPIYGLIGYIVIFLAATYKKTKLLLGMATFGLIFCLYIAYRELFQLHVICPVCVLCQINMLTVFILSLVLLRKKKTP
ncbi:MAG: vitamin K epoxide reductase family protein [Patescibacteria group bacterium]